MTTVPATAEVLAHRLEGEGDEVVLLLNGGMMTLSAWQQVVIGLRRDFRVLRCDFRGQLLSPGKAPPSFEGHAEDVVKLLDALGLESVHVLGVSFGGEVGLVLAGKHPARVRSLIAGTATDHAGDVLRQGTERMRGVLEDIRQGGDKGRFHDVLVEEVFSPEWAKRFAWLLKERRRQVALLADSWFEGIEGILDATLQLDVRPWLGEIRCPTRVIIAGRDAIMPPADSRHMAAAIAGAEVVEHPTAGHTLIIEDPPWFLDACRSFLERVATRPVG